MADFGSGELVSRLRAKKRLSREALSGLVKWLDDPELAVFAPEIELLVRQERWDLLEDSFYTRLNIGTGGIRGALGVGPNRVNSRTIGEAAQGLSRFIDDYGPEAKRAGVVVGYEARKQSEGLATLCCEVFAANGIRSYLFDGLRATPEVSFAVRRLRATAGVQITASHNPRTDNGFKFYWSDGGQVVPPHDARFMQLVAGVRGIRTMPIGEARSRGFVTGIGKDVDDAYLGAVRGLSTTPSRSARVVFSPIHGAGSTNVLPVLRDEGFHVSTVAEQLAPDEMFPTAPGDLINPEYREVMELPIRLARTQGADIAICSDPDADRVGVAAKISWDSPEVRLLTGNQVGAALTHYLLSRRRESGRLEGGDLVLTTLVTTGLIADVARGFGLSPRDDLPVGFKFIARIIEQMDDTAGFVFAAEESLGYLAGDFVRDKDAAIASLLICEMASWLKDRGTTVPAYLDELYERNGYYKNVQYLVELPGKTGRDVMRAVMLHLRSQPPASVAGLPVTDVEDRLDEALRSPDTYRMGGSDDIVTLFLSPDRRTRITVRPSGTEPKLKCYVQHHGAVDGDLAVVKDAVDSTAALLGEGILDYAFAGLPEALRDAWRSSTRRVV
jgi:phosphoglucomutase/phosphomannomutase